MRVQDNFFIFRGLFGESESLTGTHRLYYKELFKVDDHEVAFHCFNTAWMSEIQEAQGQILFPFQHLPDSSEDADLSIALLHHPYNWLEATNSRRIRQYIETRCEIVLTGHEHVQSRYRKETSSEQKHDYMEGAVLQSSIDPNKSGFAAMLIDLGRKQMKIATWSWQENLYHRLTEADWQSFRQTRENTKPITTENFSEYLTDLGTGFTHPRKSRVELPDLFVYPDLENLSTDSKGSAEIQDERTISSEELAQKDAPYRVLVIGSDKAGKTTLAKMLYINYQRRGLIPLLIDGGLLNKGHNPEKLVGAIDAAIVEQYGAGAVERFRQLSAEAKILLIDNLHQSGLNGEGLSALLNNLSQDFVRMTVFANESFFFDKLVHADRGHDDFLSFSIFRIREMGHKLRGRLVDSWVNLGREFDSDDRTLAVAVNKAEQHIAILIGKNLLPSYPIFILTILQIYEAQRPNSAPSGSYGYYYEYLINSALNITNASVPLDTLYTVTGRIAFAMFKNDQRKLDKEQFQGVLDDYERDHDIHVSSGELIRILRQARIIVWDQYEDHCFFYYKYAYFYFVALYLKENAYQKNRKQEVRRVITQLVDSIHVEQFVNILIFFVYLTKDEGTIIKLLKKASGLYEEYAPCDFDQDVRFATQLSRKAPTIKIEEVNTTEHKERFRDQMDEAYNTERVDNEEEFEGGIRLNEAFKTLQAIGQVLRNFPGSLTGTLKTSLARESYLLGLRVLGYICHFLGTNMEDLKDIFKDLLRESIKKKIKKKWDTKEKVDRKAEKFLFFLSTMLAVGLIRRVSFSVGSAYLAKTYEKVEDPRFPISIALIDLAIKLDHFDLFPGNDIKGLYDSVHGNVFTSTVLRSIVVGHLYLFPVDYRMRQSVCDHLKIKVSQPKVLIGRDRKMR